MPMATSDNADRQTQGETRNESTASCPECGGQIRSRSNERICVDCGLVLDDRPIDTGPEWRPFDGDERERTGAPLTPTRHDRGLSTELWGSKDANGNAVSPQKRRQLGRLKREHTRGRWRSKSERNLAHGLSETRRVVSALDLPQSIRDQACALFRSAANEDLLPGRSIEAIAAGSVYAACWCTGLPRTLEEVATVAGVGLDGVENGYSVLNRELGLPAQVMRPDAFVPRFASTLHLPERIRRRARKLADVAADVGVSTGTQPTGFAAACIYTAAQEQGFPITQARIAEVAGTSAATIRTHRDALQETVIDD